MRNGSRTIPVGIFLVGLSLVLALFMLAVELLPGGMDGTSITRAGVLAPTPTETPDPTTPTATVGPIVWSADHETGDLAQWSCCGPNRWTPGGGTYNSGISATSVTTEVVHSGLYAGKNIVFSDPQFPGDSACRVFRTHLERVGISEAYYSAWYYFASQYTVPNWWNVWEWKSDRPDGSWSDPMWVINMRNRPNGAMYLSLRDRVHEVEHSQTRSDFPPKRWVHLEAYYKAATDNTGSIKVWQDNVLLWDFQDVQTTQSASYSWALTNYPDYTTPRRSVVYFDDVVISRTRLSVSGDK